MNKLLPILLMVVIGLSLLPVINSFADEITYEPVETAFVDGAVLPATEHLVISWTTLPSAWSTASDKSFVNTTADYLFVGINSSAAVYAVDGSSTALAAQTSITLDTRLWTTANLTIGTPDALATTYGITYTDTDDYGIYYDTPIGTLVNLIPLFYVITIMAGVVVYIKFS